MSGDHGAAARTAGNEGRLRIALALTGTYLVAEVVGGLITGSLALLSDAAHMFTDVMALAVSLVAIRIGKRQADARRTFGYYRFEILAAALNASVLFLIAFYILYEAYRRFQDPPQIETGLMLIVATGGLIINIVSERILRASSSTSLNVKGAYLEVLADLLGSVAVIAAALVIRFTGLAWVDPLLGAAIGLWVLPRTWILLSQSVNVLLEGVPEGVELGRIQAALEALPGVREVHELHVWAITSGQNSLTAHLVVEGPPDPSLVREAQRVALEYGIEHTSVQIDDAETAAGETARHGRWA